MIMDSWTYNILKIPIFVRNLLIESGHHDIIVIGR